MGLKAIKTAEEVIEYVFVDDAGQDSPQMPQLPKTDIELLQEKNEALQNLVAQTNTDFASFMDFFFEMNPDLA